MRLIYLAIGWVLGISLSRAIPAIQLHAWVLLCAPLLLALLLPRLHRRRWLLLTLAAFFAGGARQSLVPTSSEIAQHNGFNGTITGLVLDEPKLRDDSIQLKVEAESIFVHSSTAPISGLVLVEARAAVEVNYGDRIRATGSLDTPATGDSFSYADYLGRQGVFTVLRHAGVEVIGSGHGSPFMSTLFELKQIVKRSIASALPEPQASLLTGILLGDESGISPGLEEDFQRVGASHVIAISGFNMVIVSAIVMRVFSSLFSGNKTAATTIAITVVLIYSIFVGASPGILRAALMSSLLIIGSQLNRKTFVPTSLAFATILLSAGDPNVLLDIGFQLSFFAVLGLGLFADPLSLRFRRLLSAILPDSIAGAVHSFLNEPLIVSLAAQISTLPLIILYFGRLSLVALPVNLLIVPIQSVVLLLGLVAVTVYTFAPALGMLLFWAEMIFLSWTISVVRSFARWEYAELVLNMDGRLIQVFYLLMMGGAMLNAARPPIWTRLAGILRRQAVIVSTGLTAVVLLILMAAMGVSRPDGNLHVWLLDVGHSNAVLMQTPGGAQILVDGGRFPSRLLTAIGDRLPFYDREIEILAITHPDEWDIGALNSVLDRYTIGAALYHGQRNRAETFQAITTRLAHSDTQVVAARAGYSVEMSDGTVIEVLHPQTQPSISDKLSDHVMVLRVSYGDVSFLLTSDLSVAGQRQMLAAGVSPVASVLQIPQHGTARAIDSNFLALVQPQLALLQSDIANRRDDPDPDTLMALQDLPLFRTDESGTIHLWTDGEDLRVAT